MVEVRQRTQQKVAGSSFFTLARLYDWDCAHSGQYRSTPELDANATLSAPDSSYKWQTVERRRRELLRKAVPAQSRPFRESGEWRRVAENHNIETVKNGSGWLVHYWTLHQCRYISFRDCCRLTIASRSRFRAKTRKTILGARHRLFC